MYTDFFYFLSVFIRVNPWQNLFSLQQSEIIRR